MNTATLSTPTMESLVALAGMTAFAEDCDRLVKRVKPAEPRLPDSDPAAPAIAD
jgi:hypothetical protein